MLFCFHYIIHVHCRILENVSKKKINITHNSTTQRWKPFTFGVYHSRLLNGHYKYSYTYFFLKKKIESHYKCYFVTCFCFFNSTLCQVSVYSTLVKLHLVHFVHFCSPHFESRCKIWEYAKEKVSSEKYENNGSPNAWLPHDKRLNEMMVHPWKIIDL